jgi:hypothetical protein
MSALLPFSADIFAIFLSRVMRLQLIRMASLIEQTHLGGMLRDALRT